MKAPQPKLVRKEFSMEGLACHLANHSAKQRLNPIRPTNLWANRQTDGGYFSLSLQEEQRRQQAVPPRGPSNVRTKSGGTQGHRRSRMQGRGALLDSKDNFEGKGGKEGKPSACGPLGKPEKADAVMRRWRQQWIPGGSCKEEEGRMLKFNDRAIESDQTSLAPTCQKTTWRA
jgi:hypothetical protein